MTTRTGSSTRTDQIAGVSLNADLGLLLIRLVIGLLFIGHGTGKLFGWFGQGGIKGTGAFFNSVGYHPAETLAAFTGIIELAAGILLCLGFLIPLASAIIIGDMMNAAFVKSADGFWIADDGYEYELVLILLVTILTITGAGVYALDRDRQWFRNRAGGLIFAVVLGVIAGVIMMIVRD
jgi:putative oxidoreductase